jgi:hypothetical protein
MLGLFLFSFKIVYAAIIGGALNYVPGEESDRYKIIESSLTCIFGAAILGLTSQISGIGDNYPMGFGIISVIIGIIYISKNKEVLDCIISYFSAVSGMIIGSGYILQASVLIILIYIIIRNSERLINYVESGHDQSDDKVVENITN